MARPWPNRYTRARLGGLKGFVVRPRMGPIMLDADEIDLIVRHGGWAPPFEDENGEPNLVDGVNPGEPLSISSERPNALHDFGALDGSGPHYNVRGDSAKRKGHHRHGVIDWRSSDGKHVLSWAAMNNRYAAPGTSTGLSGTNSLWYRGRKNGAIPNGGDLDDEIPRPVKGACRYVDADTGTAWFVVIAFVQTDSLREANDYTEEVWMRRAGRDYQAEVTTEAEIDQIIQDIEDPALKEQQQDNLAKLRAELGKWQRVANVDADALLPAPPTGDPKVSPVDSDVAYWLFNASGNECQTIRMVMVSAGGTFDPGSWGAQDQQRLKLNLTYTITEQTVAGETFYRPAAISQTQAFDVLSGTVSSSHIVAVSDSVESKEIWESFNSVCTGEFHDVVMAKNASNDLAEDEDWTYTFAVDYIGDQAVFASYHYTRDYDLSVSVTAEKNTLDRCGDPNWADTGSSTTATFFALAETETKSRTYNFNGRLVSVESTRERSISQNDTLAELDALPWEYDAKLGPNGDSPSATEFIDESTEGIGVRYMDLRLGILHYVSSSDTLDDDTDSSEARSKQVSEIADIAGTVQTLQTDIDSATTDNTHRSTVRFNADPTERDESSSEPATFGTISDQGAARIANPKSSVDWDRDADGNYMGSAILGESFQPYDSTGFGPHGHETAFNRYDGALDSVQDLFGIQPVNAGDVFVCYPVAFVGA